MIGNSHIDQPGVLVGSNDVVVPPASPVSPSSRTTRRGSLKSEDTATSIRLHKVVALSDDKFEIEDDSGKRKPLSDNVVQWVRQRNGDTLLGALAFVPWILQQAYREDAKNIPANNLTEKTLKVQESVSADMNTSKLLLHRGLGAVVFADASGFTALIERLDQKSNGAEMLSQCLLDFFTPLINLTNSYRGDVIKFKKDALMVYFPSVDDTECAKGKKALVPPHGSYGFPDLGPMSTAVLRASACCVEIHKRLHMFDTGVGDLRIGLHIGLGCGEVTILQVGGEVPPECAWPRSEYIIAGPPLEQISIAEPLAKIGETCVSPQAWEHIRECVVEDTRRKLEDRPDYHLLLKMDETKYTFPTIKHAAMSRDRRHETQFKLSELNILRRFIPSVVFKQIEGGTLTYVNEMRSISTIFISVQGVDVSTDEGAKIAQELMCTIQRQCYAHEGTLNKCLIDDKGMLFLLVFGLPPLVHTDDPTRAVLSCFDMVKSFKKWRLIGKFGVTTGRAYCGTCGSASRMEYTVLGDNVNLAASLMAAAPRDGILLDETTQKLVTVEIVCEPLEPLIVKGKTDPVPVYAPACRAAPQSIGIGPGGRLYLPWCRLPLGGVSLGKGKSGPPIEQQLKANMLALCRLRDWDCIEQVQKVLGGPFSAELHESTGLQSILPPAAPLCTGHFEVSALQKGVPVVIEGRTGTGKVELVEHLVVYAASNLKILPVFGSIGPRPGDPERLGVELLRSTVAVYRHLDRSLPADDEQALALVLPSHLTNLLPEVRQAFHGDTPEEDRRQEVLFILIDVAIALIEDLRQRTQLVVVLQQEFGTNIFGSTQSKLKCFWKVVSLIYNKIVRPTATNEHTSQTLPNEAPAHHEAGTRGAVSMIIMISKADEKSKAVIHAQENKRFISTSGLSQESALEYSSHFMKVPQAMMPQPLASFICKISQNNPLYIREMINELLRRGHVQVVTNSAGVPESVSYEEDLESINIAQWSQTAMVGETVMKLESLEPLESAVLKMGTVFTGIFTLPDLASSRCSRWAGATNFDNLQLFRAMQNLVKRGLFDLFEADLEEESQSEDMGGGHGELQCFVLRSVLVRKVGQSMVLEAQRKTVKRQALIDRVLSRDLPARMTDVYYKRMEPHVPWYYENSGMERVLIKS